MPGRRMEQGHGGNGKRDRKGHRWGMMRRRKEKGLEGVWDHHGCQQLWWGCSWLDEAIGKGDEQTPGCEASKEECLEQTGRGNERGRVKPKCLPQSFLNCGRSVRTKEAWAFPRQIRARWQGTQERLEGTETSKKGPLAEKKPKSLNYEIARTKLISYQDTVIYYSMLSGRL